MKMRFPNALILFCGFALAVYGQERPLITEDIDITPAGSVKISVGTDFYQNAKFPLSGLKGDLTRVGDIRLTTGYSGNVQVSVEGSIQDYLAVNSRTDPSPIPINIGPNSTSDFGDLRTTVKLKFRNESENLPAFGVAFGFRIPNTDQARGIGTNQIDLFTRLIVQKTFGKEAGKKPKLKLYGNIGFSAMTAPLDRFTQNDLLLYGIAGIYRINDRISIASEFNGSQNTRGTGAPIGTESQSQFRIGTQIRASGLTFDSAAIFGLTRYSPRTGITFGVTYQSPRIFEPAQ
ncbi:MAG: transporter [Pyrinomonadaceae bacterium]